MKDIFWLMRKTLMNTFRSKKRLLLYFGLPLAGVFLSMLIYGSGSGMDLKIAIVNQDGGQPITQDAIRFVEGLEHVKISELNEAEINGKLANGTLDSAIVFHNGFAQKVRSGQPANNIQIVSVKGAQVTAYVKAFLYGYVDNITAIGKAAAGNNSVFDQMYAAYRQDSFKLTAETLKDTSHMKDMTNQTVGFLMMFMLFSAVSLSEIILWEKEKRTYFRLLTTPISARTFVLSNVLVNFTVMAAQIVIALVVMKELFHIDSGVPFWQMFLSLLLFALVSIGLSLAIVAFAKNIKMAGAIQNLIITPSCLLSGCFFPVDIMPESVRKIADFLPQHWLLDTFGKLQEGSGFGSLYLNLLILLAFSAAFALIAVYRFGRNNDARIFI